MCRPSRFDLEGRSYVVTIASRGAVDAAASARKVRAGRVVPVSPKPRVDERRCSVRLANILAARVHTAARPCGIRRTRVRQNRVVPAVVATVKPSRRCGASNRINHIGNSRGEGGQKEFGSRESTA